MNSGFEFEFRSRIIVSRADEISMSTTRSYTVRLALIYLQNGMHTPDDTHESKILWSLAFAGLLITFRTPSFPRSSRVTLHMGTTFAGEHD